MADTLPGLLLAGAISRTSRDQYPLNPRVRRIAFADPSIPAALAEGWRKSIWRRA
jgi:hypothetical protein